MKTARFADVVKIGGTPETYLLWMPAADDRVFQRALKENRIVTLHQELRGSKKDYGQVGFHEEPNAQYIIFPKSVGRFKDRHVIGIDYDLFAKSSRTGVVAAPVARARKLVPPKDHRGQKSMTADAAEILNFAPSPDSKSKRLRQSSRVPDATETAEPGVAMSGAAAEREPVAPPTKAPARSKHPSKNDVLPKFLAEVEKTMKELRSGKPVVAYQRLETLVRNVQAAITRPADEEA